MRNESRTYCEQGDHEWGKLYACAEGPKRICRHCGQVATIDHYGDWVLVPKK